MCTAFGLPQSDRLTASRRSCTSVDDRGLEVFRNVMQLVQAMEGDNSLPRFAAFGQRSLAAVFFCFALVNNDMKGKLLGGMTYIFMQHVLRAFTGQH
jgi:hypothetical protein